MPLWIPITLLAAFVQNLRSVAQKHLKSAMGTTGATFVRFGFGAPFALAFLAAIAGFGGGPIPGPNPVFLLAVVVGALMQILGQALMIHLFSFRNFAVGSAYSRTEPAQAAIFGLVLLGDRISLGAVVAIAISVSGVMLISVAQTALTWRSLLGSLVSRNALIGLGSGTAFGVSAVCYRAASLSLEGPNAFTQAATTLVWTILFQTLVMGAWIYWRERAEIARIAKAWKVSLFAGAMGASASLLWFTAMTLQSAGVVKALAQVEMLFTFAATIFFFRERVSLREIMGCALISLGIVTLMLWG